MRLLIAKLQGQKLQVNLCRYMNENKHVPHVAVVGSGPAGFYTAQQLLKVRPFTLISETLTLSSKVK